MAMSNDDKLVHMANQIARNLQVQGHDEAVAATLSHIVKFWDPRMKATIVALAAEGAGHLACFLDVGNQHQFRRLAHLWRD